MKKTILTLALLACFTAAFANGKAPPSRDHCEPSKPDVKTPSTPPSAGPKTPSAPSSPSRSPQSRSDTVDRPCDRLIDAPFWCPRP